MTLTLASESAVRVALLRDAGLSVQTCASGVDETTLKASLLAERAQPRDIADVLAEAKAVKISRKRSGLVIGADSVMELEGRLFDKPVDRAEARSHLMAMRGKDHRLHSAVAVAEDGAVVWRHVATATLTVRAFSDAFLTDYIAAEADALLASVGCYRLEGFGAQLFEKIDGDYFAILGLPLLPVLNYLRLRGAATT